MKSTLHRACIALAVVVFAIPAMAQTRVAVLPFRNMDGLIERNVWSIKLADSLRLALANIDPSQTAFVFIPADSVEMAISELNLDPTNPQYESDVWKAVAALGAQRVVTGNFFLRLRRRHQDARPSPPSKEPVQDAGHLPRSRSHHGEASSPGSHEVIPPWPSSSLPPTPPPSPFPTDVRNG
jgi:hypothetical protein